MKYGMDTKQKQTKKITSLVMYVSNDQGRCNK